MALFRINTENDNITELDFYHFESEGATKLSPQELIAGHPEIILSMPELEIQAFDSILVAREYSTNRGSIDLVMITKDADIILIETKLYRNPEAHRTVVAQAIDYIKAFTQIEIDQLKRGFEKSKYTTASLIESLFSQNVFCAALHKNIRTGNFRVLIIGDKIHPNILGMVESIHSAPHLAFTIFLIELNPLQYDESNILLQPSLVTNTFEVERSVIRLEIDYKKESYTVESGTPQRESKGRKPIITDEQFLNSLSPPEFTETIRDFWHKWKAMGGDIRFGTVGFTSGIIAGRNRIPLQYIYSNRLVLINDRYRSYYGISDAVYEPYISDLKRDVPRAYDLLMANKVEISYDIISNSELKLILAATIEMGKRIKGGIS